MDETTTERSSSFELARLIGVGVAIMAVSFLVVGKTRAAFSADTKNLTNSVTAGSVALSDDDSDTAMFSVTNMIPGAANKVEKCINVTYTGTMNPQAVKLYADATRSGTLHDYLDITVEEGAGAAGGSSADCTSFVSSSTPVNGGSLDDFFLAHTDYASGVTLWDPAATNETRSYRITLTLQDNNAAQGLSAGFGFTWEVQS